MNFTKELACEIVSNPKIAPFLHLPVQSGSNAVLKRMLREYTIEEYLERLAYLGSGRSSLCLSTDFIVGFPGESEADFQKTLELLDQVQFETSFLLFILSGQEQQQSASKMTCRPKSNKSA